MNKPKKKIPAFKSEAAERRFWESRATDSSEYVDWSKAQRAELPRLKPSTQSISLRLPGTLLERIRGQANRLDIPYQSLMKVWLTEKTNESAKAR